MHLIGFKAYRRGYVGCLTDECDFIYFAFSRGAFKPIQRYPRAHFESVAHFVTSLHKFVSLGFFLRRPIPLPSLENSVLEALGCYLAKTLTAEAYLSLRHMAADPMSGNRPDGGLRPDCRRSWGA
jgi:hypothetical protein